jgi:hypothetical protein
MTDLILTLIAVGSFGIVIGMLIGRWFRCGS